jgi:hypothetical protein
MKKMNLNLGGRTVQADQMFFKAIEEPWSLYKLDDGSTLKVKIVLTDVFKLPTSDPVTGLPQIMIRAGNVISLEVPEGQPSKKEVQ